MIARDFSRGALLVALLCFACGNRAGSDPFGPDAGVPAGSGNSGGAGGEGGETAGPDDPGLGGPCLDDAQCDDGIECTLDSCDLEHERCRVELRHELCADGVYCNGEEVCDPTFGCRAGGVVTCGDLDSCTIDTCVEETQSCVYEPRDADGDGDPTASCGGDDCDDFDPFVSGAASERCGNERDDDCDGETDESECEDPRYDTCSSPYRVEEDGSFVLSTAGAARDYGISCAPEGGAFRELVLNVVVPEDGPRDVSIVASVTASVEGKSAVVLAATDRCGRADGETACERGFVPDEELSVARLHLRGLEPGSHAVYVATAGEREVLVRADYREAEGAPENETCGTAEPLEPGVPVRALLASVEADLETACPAATGELVYAFELEEAADVRVRAFALDEWGAPVLSLRSAECRDLEDELTCRAQSPAELFARALPAGSYRIAVAGTGPAEVELSLQIEPPSEAPPTEGCAESPELEAGETAVADLREHVDAVRFGCLVGAPDATYALDLPEASDVLVVAKGSDDDRGAVLVSRAECASETDVLACQSGERWPIRAIAHAVPEGSARVVVESAAAAPMSVAVYTRPATSSVYVVAADECATAATIPPLGGRFEGNTANAYADYEASCDYGGQGPGGAEDQVLKLTLEEPRRMLFDMQASTFDTLLVVREGESCPGTEISGTCSPGYVTGRSFLDTVLPAGTYWVQIDGYDGARGRWTLEVFSAEP